MAGQGGSTPARTSIGVLLLSLCGYYRSPEVKALGVASPDPIPDLQGLPPLLIQVGTAEMLLDDATRLAHHAVACGVHVELELWENMVHVWQMLDGIEPRARAAVRRAGLFMRRVQYGRMEHLNAETPDVANSDG